LEVRVLWGPPLNKIKDLEDTLAALAIVISDSPVVPSIGVRRASRRKGVAAQRASAVRRHDRIGFELPDRDMNTSWGSGVRISSGAPELSTHLPCKKYRNLQGTKLAPILRLMHSCIGCRWPMISKMSLA